MSNKIKKRILHSKQDLQLIYQQISQNKSQIEQFCLKNNMKFPPLVHSRNTIYNQLSPLRSHRPTDLSDNLDFTISEISHKERFNTVKHQWLQRKPSICKIVFSKSEGRNSALLGLQTKASSLGRAGITKSMNHPKPRYYLSEDKTKNLRFLSEYNSKQNHLQHFISQIDSARSNKNSTASISQSLEMDASLSENRYELLSINRMSTINPEAELIQTLRGKNILPEKPLPSITRRQFQPKDLSRLSFYKNADGIVSPKKSQPLEKKQVSAFEPWQQSNQQEQDYLSQIGK